MHCDEGGVTLVALVYSSREARHARCSIMIDAKEASIRLPLKRSAARKRTCGWKRVRWIVRVLWAIVTLALVLPFPLSHAQPACPAPPRDHEWIAAAAGGHLLVNANWTLGRLVPNATFEPLGTFFARVKPGASPDAQWVALSTSPAPTGCQLGEPGTRLLDARSMTSYDVLSTPSVSAISNDHAYLAVGSNVTRVDLSPLDLANRTTFNLRDLDQAEPNPFDDSNEVVIQRMWASPGGLLAVEAGPAGLIIIQGRVDSELIGRIAIPNGGALQDVDFAPLDDEVAVLISYPGGFGEFKIFDLHPSLAETASARLTSAPEQAAWSPAGIVLLRREDAAMSGLVALARDGASLSEGVHGILSGRPLGLVADSLTGEYWISTSHSITNVSSVEELPTRGDEPRGNPSTTPVGTRNDVPTAGWSLAVAIAIAASRRRPARLLAH